MTLAQEAEVIRRVHTIYGRHRGSELLRERRSELGWQRMLDADYTSVDRLLRELESIALEKQHASKSGSVSD